jgi:hypothetical protein
MMASSTSPMSSCLSIARWSRPSTEMKDATKLSESQWLKLKQWIASLPSVENHHLITPMIITVEKRGGPGTIWYPLLANHKQMTIQAPHRLVCHLSIPLASPDSPSLPTH